MEGLGGRLQRDAIAAAVLAVLAEAELALGAVRPGLASMVLAPSLALPLAFRRRAALPALASILSIDVVHLLVVGSPAPALADPPNSFALAAAFIIGVYSVGAYTERRDSMAGLVLATAATALFTFTCRCRPGINDFLAAALLSVAVPWLLGVARARQLRLDETRREAGRAAAQRRVETDKAVEAERGRIARELHDIVAHSLSVIVIQAAAERRSLPADSTEAKTLDTIERTCRVALTELRRLLGLLRSGGDELLTPQPSVADVDQLVRQVTDAGLDARLVIDGTPREVPPGIALSAYRVAQEALTNVLKHADATQAEVRLRYDTVALEVVVRDNGRGHRSEIVGRGFGLVGVQERVSLFGGEVQYGPRPAGGFEVRAQFPLGAS